MAFFIHQCINGIITMINLGKLVQHKSNDKFKIFAQFGDKWLMWLVLCFLLFFIGGFFRKTSCVPKNIYQPIKWVLEELLAWKAIRMHTILSVCSELLFSYNFHHIETIQLICKADQLSGFYMNSFYWQI